MKRVTLVRLQRVGPHAVEALGNERTLRARIVRAHRNRMLHTRGELVRVHAPCDERRIRRARKQHDGEQGSGAPAPRHAVLDLLATRGHERHTSHDGYEAGDGWNEAAILL